MVREAQDGVLMTSVDDKLNPEQTRNNPFQPHRYDQIGRWIERLSPDAVTRLGWHYTNDLWQVVNQKYSLYKSSSGADEIQ
jgi:hypothetical protein